MSLIEFKVEHDPSPFQFDVWQCPECDYVVTQEIYKRDSLDLPCPCCHRTALSEFRLWPGSVSNN